MFDSSEYDSYTATEQQQEKTCFFRCHNITVTFDAALRIKKNNTP